jgi:hypothetical protein
MASRACAVHDPGRSSIRARQRMSMFRKSDSQIAVGDVLVEANREKTHWRVEFLFDDPNGVAHVRLRRVDDATSARTFAAAVLTSDPRFRRLPREASPEE